MHDNYQEKRPPISVPRSSARPQADGEPKKTRPNEVFEPIVKYPYAVLQCNGLLDE